MVNIAPSLRADAPILGPVSAGALPVRCVMLRGFQDYEAVLGDMEREVSVISSGNAQEAIWFLEHPPLYTGGTSAQAQDLIDCERFPVFQAGRGGEYTYHGPGQRVVYVMLDLKSRTPDVRAFVRALEAWIIDALKQLGVQGERREGRVGIWVARPDKGSGAEDKIAAIGIRVRKWVTFHGISINVDPDLTHYAGIVPCGISEHGVTSLKDLGVDADMAALDKTLIAAFPKYFGAVKTFNSRL